MYDFSQQTKIIDTKFLPEIKFNTSTINYVGHFSFLGIIIDDTLSWKYHINALANKISKVNGILSKLKYFFPSKILLLIYNSLITSRVNYGLLTWAFSTFDRIEIIQKKAIRNIAKAPYHSHTKPLCKKFNILLFKDCLTLACLKFYHKYNRNELPKYFYSNHFLVKYQPNRPNLRITQPTKFPDYVTEIANFRPDFLVPKNKKASSEKRLKYQLPNFLNKCYLSLPNNIMDKIFTHSISGFSNYFKFRTIESYDAICRIRNCFYCSKNLMLLSQT